MRAPYFIQPASIQDVATIASLAHTIWWHTYPGVVPDAQIAYMLARAYSHHAIAYSMQNQRWFIVTDAESNEGVGFLTISVQTDGKESWLYVHKLYLLPTTQGLGLGRQMVDFAAEFASERGINTLKLNVNRKNYKACAFYQKVGFYAEREIDIPSVWCVLTDYTMRRNLIP